MECGGVLDTEIYVSRESFAGQICSRFDGVVSVGYASYRALFRATFSESGVTRMRSRAVLLLDTFLCEMTTF